MMMRTMNPGLTTPNGGDFRVRALDPGANAPQTPWRPQVT